MLSGGGQTLQGSAKMRALAQLARQRGEKHRGGGQILRCGAAMRALARLARQGIVAVAKPYGPARRCMQLQDWDDCAVQGTVKDAVLTKKTCVLQCSTTMLAPARLARLRGAGMDVVIRRPITAPPSCRRVGRGSWEDARHLRHQRQEATALEEAPQPRRRA